MLPKEPREDSVVPWLILHIPLSYLCTHSEAAAHAVATLAEATLQGGGQIVLSGETAAAVGALTGVQDANGKRSWIFYWLYSLFPLKPSWYSQQQTR
jgi:hypothetical protein